MSTKDGGPAFPLQHTDQDGRHDCIAVGLTKREWFAGQAMQAMLPHWAGMEFDEAFDRPEDVNGGCVYRLVLSSYRIADAMLKGAET